MKTGGMKYLMVWTQNGSYEQKYPMKMRKNKIIKPVNS